jgi:hypothetical protein
LQSYKVKVYETNNSNNLLYETDTIYANEQIDKNEINTLLFLDNANISKNYTLQLDIESKNHFKQIKT